jgi:hypothetical protein
MKELPNTAAELLCKYLPSDRIVEYTLDVDNFMKDCFQEALENFAKEVWNKACERQRIECSKEWRDAGYSYEGQFVSNAKTPDFEL